MVKDKPIRKKTTKKKTASRSGKDKKQEPKPAKVVRDSFTMPAIDYEQLKQLKKDCLAKGVHIKKGELLRAGILALTAMQNDELLALLEKVERVKTGRPAKGKDKN